MKLSNNTLDLFKDGKTLFSHAKTLRKAGYMSSEKFHLIKKARSFLKAGHGGVSNELFASCLFEEIVRYWDGTEIGKIDFEKLCDIENRAGDIGELLRTRDFFSHDCRILFSKTFKYYSMIKNVGTCEFTIEYFINSIQRKKGKYCFPSVLIKGENALIFVKDEEYNSALINQNGIRNEFGVLSDYHTKLAKTYCKNLDQGSSHTEIRNIMQKGYSGVVDILKGETHSIISIDHDVAFKTIDNSVLEKIALSYPKKGTVEQMYDVANRKLPVI